MWHLPILSKISCENIKFYILHFTFLRFKIRKLLKNDVFNRFLIYFYYYLFFIFEILDSFFYSKNLDFWIFWPFYFFSEILVYFIFLKNLLYFLLILNFGFFPKFCFLLSDFFVAKLGIIFSEFLNYFFI